MLPRFFLIAGFCVRVCTDRLQWSIGVQEIRMSKETVTGICGICPGGCGVNVVLIDGKVDKIVPLKGHPMGVVCVRGVHSQEIVYSRDRLKSPLLRLGFWASVTDDVLPGQVEVNVGGGSPIHAEGWREANTNYLTDFENRDPISGFPVYKALLCDVRKRE